MRVLLLTNLFPRVGSSSGGVFITHRVEALRSLDVDVDVLALRPVRTPGVEALARLAGRPTRELVDQSDMFIDVPIPLTAAQFGSGLLGLYSSSAVARGVRAVEAAVDVSRYDVIVAHGMYLLPAGAVAAGLAQSHGIPFTVVMHGSDVNLSMVRRAKPYNAVLHRASAVVFVSEALRERARDLGYDGARAVVIPNGVDTEVFHPAPDRAPDTVANVLFVGNLVEIKGADRLPGVFHAVSHAAPDVRFTVVGSGPLDSTLTALVSGLDVEFLGRLPQPEVARAMADADVLVLPSRSEGWPCVVLEAHACELPVVATDVGGTREAVGDPRMLVTDDEQVVESLAGQVVRVLSGGGAPAGLRDRAEEYSWTSLGRLEKGLLERVVAGRLGNDAEV